MINRKLLPLFLLLLLPGGIIYAQTPCSGGFAGSYPCDGITLQGYISSSAMGGSAEAQDSWGWTDPLNNKEYAVVAMDDGTAFVDISTPTAPVYVGRLDTHTGSSLWRDVKVYLDHAFIVSDANGNHGMQVFDLTRLRTFTGSPITFTHDAHMTWGTTSSNRGRAHNIAINEATGYAYVTGVSPYISGGAVIIKLDNNDDGDPTDPAIVSTYSAGGYCHDAQVVIYNGPDTEHHGKEILIGSFSGSDFVRVLDVTNKSSIVQLSSIAYSDKYYTHQGWFTEDQRFFIVGDELDEQNRGFNTRTLVYDMSDLDNPVLHYTHYGATPAIDHNGYVRGNRFYLANYAAGMRIFKVDGLYDATPSMTEINYFDTFPSSNNAGFNATWNVYPFFESGNLIATGFGDVNVNGDGGLFILKDPLYDNTDPNVVCQNITATLNKTTGSVTITANDVDGGSTDNIGITSLTISGQSSFTCDDVGQVFNVTLTAEDDYGNTASCVAQVTVEAETTEYQGGGSWTNGTPDIGSNAKIASDYDTGAGSNSSFDACTCEIDSGRTLTIQANDYINIHDDITVNGNLVVKHQGSVVQSNSTASVTKNTGATINVEMTTPPLKPRDFMLLGSPMTAETRTDVFSSAYNVQQHTPANFIPHPSVPAGGTNFMDDNLDDWNAYPSGAITPGEGFLVYPQAAYNDPAYNGPPPVSTLMFDLTYAEGTLNNGDVSRSIIFNGLGTNPDGTPNFLANPFASAIDGSLLVSSNALINELYFWEHLTPPSAAIPGANIINVSMGDLSIYNGTMGIPAANDTGTGTTPNGVIATGQGFGIKAFGAGTVTFDNSMRLTTGNTTLRVPENLDKLTLRVDAVEYEVRSFAGIGFRPEGTPLLDENMDSNRLATLVSLYSHLEDGTEELGIQTREAFEDGMKIPMGFATQVDEEVTYEISIASLEGNNLTNSQIYLIDHLEDITTDLTQENYQFKGDKGSYNERFTLLFKIDSSLGSGPNILDTIVVFPNPTDNFINIHSPSTYLKTVEVFDVRGRRISEEIDKEKNFVTLDVNKLETGIYFVQITTEAGSVTKKIIKN